MSLVVLTSRQHQDSSTIAVDAPDAAFFQSNFSEPLTVFPGQTVELVSFSYEKSDNAEKILEVPDLLISVPELGTRGYNGSRQTIDNVVGFVPSTQVPGLSIQEDIPFQPQGETQYLRNVNVNARNKTQIVYEHWDPAGGANDSRDVTTTWIVQAKADGTPDRRFKVDDMVTVVSSSPSASASVDFKVTGVSGAIGSELVLTLQNEETHKVPVSPNVIPANQVYHTNADTPTEDFNKATYVRLTNLTVETSFTDTTNDTTMDTTDIPSIVVAQPDGSNLRTFTIANNQSAIIRKATTDVVGYSWGLSDPTTVDPNPSEGAGIIVVGNGVAYGVGNINVHGGVQTYTPPTPMPLAVNVPTRMELNTLTCKISLVDGKLASKSGGPSGSALLDQATVVLRLSAPPKELSV